MKRNVRDLRRFALRTGVPELELSARKTCDQEGAWAWSRAGPGPARTSYLHGSTRLAWVYKSSVGLAWIYKTSARKVDKHPTLNTAPARSVIKKEGSRAWVPGPGPGPGPAQRARHACMGLQV